jgi:drug/metabolite transporter (DMT)-like permease|tara:strand:- start:571 stop:1410 length:840 start_codon:yes stop_codon:yes gene_type:complete
LKSATSANIILIIAALMWSVGGLFIKLVDLSPVAITGTRSIAAALVFLIYLKKPQLYLNRYFIIGVISYAAMMLLYVFSIRLTTAANAIFLEFTAPIYVVILGYYILNERITIFDILSMFVIFSGMTLFFIDELSFYGFWGNIMAAVAGVCLGVVTIMIRKEKESAFQIVLMGNILTALVCIPFMFAGLQETASTDWFIIFVLGIVQLGIPYILYTKALRQVQALDAILVSMIEPILNPFWVYIFVGEKMGEWALVGGVLVLSGSIGRAIIKIRLRQTE